MRKNALSKRLKAAREARGLSLRDITRLSKNEISNGYVSFLENGVMKNPHPKKLRILAQILKLDFLELMVLADCITIRDLKGRL